MTKAWIFNHFALALSLASAAVLAESTCTSVPEWTIKPYAAGEQVKHASRYFQCREAPNNGWCAAGGAYEPGVGWAWAQAWSEMSSCTAAPVVNCGGAAPWQAGTIAAGAKVTSQGSLYECKPYPNSGWCGQSAYAPGNSANWPTAWNAVGVCGSVQSGIKSRYFAQDAEARSLWHGERTVTMPSNTVIQDMGLQWRIINALRILGLESSSITDGRTIDANEFKSIDERLVARENLFAADAARLQNYQDIWAPQFKDNLPQTMSVHLMVRTLDLFNRGARKYQSLNNQCVLANVVPAMCGILADMGTIDGSACSGDAPLRAQQIIQFPDLHTFNNVRRKITATELPSAEGSVASTCSTVVTLVHEFTHDADRLWKDSYMNKQFDRLSACGPEYMDFNKPGSPFVQSVVPGTQIRAEYISNYAAGLPNDYRPWEDAAESVTAYIVFPEYFRTKAAANAKLQARYDYVKNEIFSGVEFRNLALDHQNLSYTGNGAINSYCENVKEFRMDDIVVK